MNLKDAIDALLSDDNESQKQANIFLSEQIFNNPTFYISLIELYWSSDVPLYRKSSLSLLKKILTENYHAIMEILQEFCGKITKIIHNSTSTDEQKLLADIIYYTAPSMRNYLPLNTILEYFNDYLVLYRIKNNLIPFCVYLYSIIMRSESPSINFILANIQKEIFSEIICNGLQFDDFDVKLCSVHLFTQIFRNINDDFIDKYQLHIDIINQIAENSLEINEKNEDYFYELWSNLFKIGIKISDPLFEIAYSIFHSDNLNPKNRSILLKFIIRTNKLVKVDSIEDLITTYFITQFKLGEVDFSNANFIFWHLVNVDEKRTYELFKREIFSCLKDDDLTKQSVGISLLSGFFMVYQKYTNFDIATTFPIVFNLATANEIHLKKVLNFLHMFLQKNNVNINDSILINDFLFDVIQNYNDDSIQYLVLCVCKHLTIIPTFFEKMIGIYQNIQPKSYAVYFSILLFLYRDRSTISLDKYQPFLNDLIKIFNEYIQKADTLKKNENCMRNADNNKDIRRELYEYTLIIGSASCLILYLWFFSPIQLDKYIDLAVENIFNIFDDQYDLCYDDDRNVFSIYEIKDNFTRIATGIKGPVLTFIEDHIDIIRSDLDFNLLQNFLCSYLDLEEDFYEDIYLSFYEEIDDCISSKISVNKILPILISYADPMSKWIYKIPNVEFHKKFIRFIEMFSRPNIISYDIYDIITDILLKIVKPKRVEFNSENRFYSTVIRACHVIAKKMIDIIPNFEEVKLSCLFNGFAKLVLLFAYLKSGIGHEFLCNFLIPFYNKNQETVETEMLYLFSKLININYYNDKEIEMMIDITKGIIKRGKIYYDIEETLFELMTNLIRIRPEISPLFIDFAIEIFNKNKDDEILVDSNANCALFLLSAFNQNNEELIDKIMPLISQILEFFPISKKNKTVMFWFEIKSFVEKCKDKMTEEINETLMRCLTRYLSYQRFTNLFFDVPDEQHGEIIQLNGELIKKYISEHPDVTFKDKLNNLLPHQPTSVEFILSLYSKE